MPKLLQEDTDVLVREVQAHSGWIYGNTDRPPQTDEAEVGWEEVMVNLICPDTLRTVAQWGKNKQTEKSTIFHQ